MDAGEFHIETKGDVNATNKTVNNDYGTSDRHFTIKTAYKAS